MSYKTAWSLELETDIEAKEAHNRSLLKNGNCRKINDAKKFQCGEKCDFKLTLTNFGKENYTKAPHFTPGERNQKHNSEECGVILKKYNERNKEEVIENFNSFYRDKNKLVIDIDLVRGELAKISISQTKNENSDICTTLTKRNASNSEGNSTSKTIIKEHIKNLAKLVEFYLEYESGELYTFYNKNNQEINLEDYFVNLKTYEVNKVNLEDIHIYFDTVSVDYRTDTEKPENNYFLIKFISECTIEDVSAKPSIVINKNRAKHHGVKGKLKILEKAAKDGQPLKLFYFGSFRKHQNGKYINPSISNDYILDYLVIS